jgi:ligand-binding sensor domain-containing protein/two-component sensor histidine kinase
MFSRFLNTSLFLFIAMAIQSQSFDKKDFKIYRTKDGLSYNNVNVITQDTYGYIWIGTEKGLNRFDGINFRQFYSDSLQESLSDDRVFKLKWINSEELATLTDAGLNIVNTRTLQMQNIVIPADSTKDPGNVNRIKDLAADKKQNLFIATSGGFYHYHSGVIVFRYDTVGDFAWDVIRLNDNIVLLATTNGLYIYDVQKKDFHPLGDQDDPFFHSIAEPKQTFRFTYSDENYFATSYMGKDGLVLFDINKRTRQQIIPPPDNSKKINLNWELFRLNDTLIASPSNHGFCTIHLDRPTNSWILDTSVYLENISCSGLFVDKNNHAWISTDDGIYKQKTPGGQIDQKELPGGGFSVQRTVTGVTVANNRVFAATVADGIYVFDKDSFLFLKRIIYPEKQNFITQLLKENEDSLISVGSGFMVNTRNFAYKKIESVTSSREGSMRVALKDSHNKVYFIKFHVDSIFFRSKENDDFSSIALPELGKFRPPTKMAEDNEGNIWLGGEGLMRLNVRSQKIDLQLDSFPFIKRQSKEISSNIVFDKEGRMYFGVFGNGLMIYDIKNKHFSHLTRFDGLPDNVIKALYLHKETLWIATENGLASYDIADNKISSYGVSDGMPTDPNGCTVFYYDTAAGMLYVAFSQIIVRFDPVKLKKNQNPPDFFIESIDITGKGQLFHPDQTITIPYKFNSLIINLGAINYEDASQQLFAYRVLKKGNEAWQELGAQRSIFFNDLPPGTHRLQVKVYIRNQSWPEQVKEIILRIRPPFWKTIWFYLILGLLLAAILFYLHRIRIKQLTQKANIDKQLAQTEMKALHAQMNPHFIFNCLNSIREMILNNENEQASVYLSKFARLIRITLNQSSKPFVSLADTVDYLERYIEMEKIRSSHFTYTMDVAKDLNTDDVMVPPMLIQPFIENAIWHGVVPKKNMDIHISFRKKGNELICIVDDNGIGIEESLKQKENIAHEPSVGIANIKQRIGLLNEKYNLQSTVHIEDKLTLPITNGTGTIVTLHLPIKTNESLWAT